MALTAWGIVRQVRQWSVLVAPLGVGHDPSGHYLGQGEGHEQGKAEGLHSQEVRAIERLCGPGVSLWTAPGGSLLESEGFCLHYF